MSALYVHYIAAFCPLRIYAHEGCNVEERKLYKFFANAIEIFIILSVRVVLSPFLTFWVVPLIKDKDEYSVRSALYSIDSISIFIIGSKKYTILYFYLRMS